jgi:hypothetical protein
MLVAHSLAEIVRHTVCVIAKLASDGWFSIYLCCFQEFPVKHRQHNQIMVIKRKKYY